MPTCFAAIGQDRDDPDHLLLLGDDGRFYGLSLPDGTAVPADPADDAWEVDGVAAGPVGAAPDSPETMVARLFETASGPPTGP